jgi:hypothetical protein
VHSHHLSIPAPKPCPSPSPPLPKSKSPWPQFLTTIHGRPKLLCHHPKSPPPSIQLQATCKITKPQTQPMVQFQYPS